MSNKSEGHSSRLHNDGTDPECVSLMQSHRDGTNTTPAFSIEPEPSLIDNDDEFMAANSPALFSSEHMKQLVRDSNNVSMGVCVCVMLIHERLL